VPAATLVAGLGLVLIAGAATFSPIRDREPGRAVPQALPAPSRS
jgi:hypothetical protein